ncbi:MAG: sodium:alanine symporter family protein [Lachnospiraceae bacterium]|nr:sodium:alanine symporter family protein [Lachnospiraceae bacterium]
MTFSEIITAIDDWAWGYPLLIMLVGTGLFLSIRMVFVQFRKFGFSMRNTMGKIFSGAKAGKGEVTPFQALTTALAATVGTGNIVGVTGAIILGGPGAVFWMWISALIGMCTKFSEVVLAIRYREKNKKGEWVGGPMYYIKNGLGKNWKWLGIIFSIFGALCAFGIGNATQVNSIATAVSNAIDSLGGDTGAQKLTFLGSEFTLSFLITGIVVAIIIAIVVIGGVKIIGQITEKIVPFMAVVYIIATLIVIFADIRFIGEVLRMIFVGAFTPSAIVGGALGITIMTSIKRGVGRGCFSNEAGMGSAPMAHAASSESNPIRQGVYGIFEVFMDTIVICTLTCLTVLITNCSTNGAVFTFGDNIGSVAVSNALGSVLSSGVGSVILAVCLSLFALSTIMSWSLYGVRCCEYLFNGNKVAVTIYKIIFVLFVIMGATLALDDVWNIADILNACMAVPNLIALVALSPKVVKLTKDFFTEQKKIDKERKAEKKRLKAQGQ